MCPTITLEFRPERVLVADGDSRELERVDVVHFDVDGFLELEECRHAVVAVEDEDADRGHESQRPEHAAGDKHVPSVIIRDVICIARVKVWRPRMAGQLEMEVDL